MNHPRYIALCCALALFLTGCLGTGEPDEFFGTGEFGKVGNAAIRFSPDTHDFGAVGTNTASTPFEIQLSNRSSSAIYLVALPELSDPNYTVTNGSCSTTVPMESGATCTVFVTFSPKSAGQISYPLSITYGRELGLGEFRSTAAIKGVGAGPLSFDGIDSVTNVTSTSAQLNWTDTANEQGYMYFRINAGNQVYLGFAVENASSVVVSGLSANTSYTFRVQAVDLLGETENNTKDITITTSPRPLVTNLTAPANGNYNAGAFMDFSVQYDVSVDTTGAPRIVLDVGGATRYANLTGGGGSNTLTFRYTLSAGDVDHNGIAFASTNIDLNTGTINGSADSEPASLDFSASAPDLSSIIVDTTTPSVTGLANDTNWTNNKTWSWGCSEVCTYRFVVDTSPTTNPSGAYGGTTTANQSAGVGTYYVHVQARDLGGNESAVVHVSALIDTVAPTFGGPLDITGNDAIANVNQAVTTNWIAATDANSGLDHYEIAIGYDNEPDSFDSGDVNNVLNWSTVPGGTGVTGYQVRDGVDTFTLSINNTDTYYVSIQVVDRAGNYSSVVSSSGWTGEYTPRKQGNLDVWLDSTDLTTLFTDSACLSSAAVSSAVGCWVDKSASARRFTQGSGTSQPLVAADGITFDGGNDILTNALSYAASDDISIYVEFEHGAQSTNGGSCCRPLVSWVTASGGLYPWLGSTRGDLAPANNFFFGWAGGPESPTALGIGSDYMVNAIHDGGNSVWNTFLQGSSTASGIAIPGSYTTTNLGIGGDPNNGARRYSGKIAEVLFFSTAHGTADRQLLEGYLACKYNRRDALPGLHPYYNASPASDVGCP